MNQKYLNIYIIVVFFPVFFSGYCFSQFWTIANELHFAIELPECYSTLNLAANLAKLTLAVLLIIAINIKVIQIDKN